MRKRQIRAQVWLNEQEVHMLKSNAVKAGMSTESYIRMLIIGFIPRELPPIEYYNLIRELNAIGNNLNQIAAQANATKHIDKTTFIYEANCLRRAIQEIQEAVTAPERMNSKWPPPPSGK